jgi:hypothetical protein
MTEEAQTVTVMISVIVDMTIVVGLLGITVMMAHAGMIAVDTGGVETAYHHAIVVIT